MVKHASTSNPPPRPLARDGVSASCVQVPAGSWPSLLDFLCAQFPAIGRDTWQSRCERGLVLDAAGNALAATANCRSGDRIHYFRELAHEPLIPFSETILYRDEHLLVADKPHFLPVIPSGRFVQQTLLVRLKKSTGIDTLSPIHRIDRDTAGLVMFSANPDTRDAYQALFRSRAVKKTYHAIAPLLQGHQWPLQYRSRLVEDEKFFRSREVPGDANSETLIRVLQEKDGMALYELQPVTGRKHQLRVNMVSLGAAIINDRLYPLAQDCADGDFSKPLQLLAHSLAFADPLTGQPREFCSQLRLQL